MDITKFGKGCIPVPENLKVKHPLLSVAAIPPVDWTKPFDVESWFKLPVFNQDGSSSCTAQATCYYCMALMELDNKKFEEYSRRYIYSQACLPGGGAYIADAMAIPLEGAASELSVPEGDSSETTMKDASLNLHADIEARAEKYACIQNNHDIDYLAGLIEQYGGFVTGFHGSNDMFDPKGVAGVTQNPTWSHCVWVCGYKILPDGRRALKFKNSWSAAWGDGGYGYFPEDFVKSNLMFDAYVYADIEDLMLPTPVQQPASTSPNQTIPAIGPTGRPVVIDNQGTEHTMMALGWIPGTPIDSLVIPGTLKVTISPLE